MSSKHQYQVGFKDGNSITVEVEEFAFNEEEQTYAFYNGEYGCEDKVLDVKLIVVRDALLYILEL